MLRGVDTSRVGLFSTFQYKDSEENRSESAPHVVKLKIMPPAWWGSMISRTPTYLTIVTVQLRSLGGTGHINGRPKHPNDGVLDSLPQSPNDSTESRGTV